MSQEGFAVLVQSYTAVTCLQRLSRALSVTDEEGEKWGAAEKAFLMGTKRNKITGKGLQGSCEANPLRLSPKPQKQHWHFSCSRRAPSLCPSSSAAGAWGLFVLRKQEPVYSPVPGYGHLHLPTAAMTKGLCWAPVETQAGWLPASQAHTHTTLSTSPQSRVYSNQEKTGGIKDHS